MKKNSRKLLSKVALGVTIIMLTNEFLHYEWVIPKASEVTKSIRVSKSSKKVQEPLSIEEMPEVLNGINPEEKKHVERRKEKKTLVL